MPLIGHCSPRLPEETVTRLLLLTLLTVTQVTRQAARKRPSKLCCPVARCGKVALPVSPLVSPPSLIWMKQLTRSTYATPTKVRFTSLIHRPVTAARRLVAVPPYQRGTAMEEWSSAPTAASL